MLMLQIWMRTAVVYSEGHWVKRGREQHHLQTNRDKIPRRAGNNGGINNSIQSKVLLPFSNRTRIKKAFLGHRFLLPLAPLLVLSSAEISQNHLLSALN